MTMNGKILAVGLSAALLGGTVVGLVNNRHSVDPNAPVASQNLSTQDATRLNGQTTKDQVALNTANDQNLSADYRTGFEDGFNAAREGATDGRALAPATTTVVREVPTASRVVYRSAPARTRTVRSTRRAYYDYTPQRRSFWQKHRDKLTVAMGAGGGALLGGLLGGKKGAAIGALAGGGGSALYTYKIRRRNH
ncbi:MAG TPA: hypothetical protein VF525_07650 [Pyrinomonadaceae bacterium]